MFFFLLLMICIKILTINKVIKKISINNLIYYNVKYKNRNNKSHYRIDLKLNKKKLILIFKYKMGCGQAKDNSKNQNKN